MRTWKEAEDAGKKVGFELVSSIDLAVASSVCGPWCETLILPVMITCMKNWNPGYDSFVVLGCLA